MTAQNKPTSPLSLIVPVILLVSLVAGLILIRSTQDSRKGAYFASTTMLLQPETMEKNVGDNVPVVLYVNTSAKVDFVKAKICYTSLIGLDESNPTSRIEVNNEAFSGVELAKIVNSTIPEQKCLNVAVRASGGSEELKSGMVKVATIKFTALAAGSGQLVIDKAASQVSGYNSAGNDMSIKVEEVAKATFTIRGAEGSCGWCGTSCVRKTSGMQCLLVLPPDGKQCVEVNGDCVVQSACSGSAPADVCTAERLKVSATCNNGTWDWDEQLCNQAGRTSVCGGTNYCCKTAGGSWTTNMDGCESTPTSTPIPTTTPISTTGDSVLNYRVQFKGLQSDAKCAVNWPVTITVLANGISKTYSDTPVMDGSSYKGTLTLTGFNAREGVAVFIKGPQHIQMKYGKNGQVTAYAKAGGEIVLTSLADTSPWYDFSGYPIVAGDVIGTNSDTQDGWINGVDFSYVKQRSLTHETAAEGSYLRGDLDGNCQVNSNDVNVLKISLNEKQGELY